MHHVAREVAVPIDGALLNHFVDVSVVRRVREHDGEGEHDRGGRDDDDQKLPTRQGLGTFIPAVDSGPQGDAGNGHW